MLNSNLKPLWGVAPHQTILIDFFALVFILLMPAVSHLTRFPIYLIEPMRIMLVVSIIFSSRYNAYALAIMLPLFSFLVSGHPAPVKMVIIIAELLINVWLFLRLAGYTKKSFIAMALAILISKVFCYLLYWMVLSWSFVVEESSLVFILAQLILTTVLSSFIGIVTTKRRILAMD
ncbi:MAG: hypothetical protein A2Y40_08650 [Candidatus Margulisbacteria bacterium GWF2_35_9]|nr:MAG: hypothetical protein A2Y40_08650 [Candidatus Margulisbacteria bacterium GWF2_35_9]